ncbi:MAG: hypothetical protein IJT25_00975, partial [Clostridia bacterium]|nr:hypothetical protein [Clostridia bacterium]
TAIITLLYVGEDADNYTSIVKTISRNYSIIKTIEVESAEEYVLAFATASQGNGVVININADLDLSNKAMVVVSSDTTINLNGHTLNAGLNGDYSRSILQVVNDATLTINGTEEGSKVYGRLNVGNSHNNNGNLVLNGGEYYVYGEQTVIHVNGECKNSNVYILNAEVESEADNGVQFNGAGEFVIENSTVSGYTAIYMKGGVLRINGSTITANGMYKEPTLNTNGSNPTGDAIVLDTTLGYQGNIEIYIENNSKVESYYAYALRESIVDDRMLGTETRVISAQNATLFGFSKIDAIEDEDEQQQLKDIAENDYALNLTQEFLNAVSQTEGAQLVIKNIVVNQDLTGLLLGIKNYEYGVKETNEDGVYEVAQRTVIEVSNAEEYAQAFVDADENCLIKLTDDITYSSLITVNKNIVLDLNGHTLNSGLNASEASNKAFEVYNSAFVILGEEEGSTIIGRINVGTATDQNGSLVLMGGTYKAVGAQCVIHVNGTCTNCSIVIMNATVESENDNAIQFNGAGTYMIDSSTIIGYTAIYMKAGVLSINDSQVLGNGEEAKEITTNHNGSNATADAIVLDSTIGYQGNMIIVFSGDNVVASKKGYAVKEALGDTTSSGTRMIMVSGGIFRGADDKDAISISDSFIEAVGNNMAFVMIAEGTSFSSDIAQILPEGFVTTEYDIATGLYVVTTQE